VFHVKHSTASLRDAGPRAPRPRRHAPGAGVSRETTLPAGGRV